jgi:hypothetical protein
MGACVKARPASSSRICWCRDGSRWKEQTLDLADCHRRRHDDVLGHRHRVEHLTRCRVVLGATEPPAIAGRSLRRCPLCQTD